MNGKSLSKQLPDNASEAQLAGLIVVGLLMFIFEAYIPRPIPWLKLGLANVATILALYWLGWRAAVLVSVFRIVIGAFFTGMLFSPGFFLSLSGGLAAVLAMAVLWRMGCFGIIAVSISGAIAHSFTQLLVAVYFLFNNSVLWYVLPYLLLTAILTGALVGWFSRYLLLRLRVDLQAGEI